MKLTQERFLRGTTEFELIEDVLHVRQKSFLKSSSYEVPLNGISSSISTVRRFPLVWCLIASTASVAFVVASFSVFFAEGDSQLGLGALVMLIGIFAVLTWHGFLERRIDFVMLNSKEYNTPQVYIHRTLPSVRHVEEFVEIVKESVEAQTQI